jgi:pimeloyl-ACP methyl ester carboxylesterase
MRRFTVAFLVFLLAFSYVAFAVGPAFAASGEDYRVITEDGANLGLKHYRPEQTAEFNTGRQPVLFMPGALTNSNEFDVRTPDGQTCRVTLPANLPDWAKNDKYIKRDHAKLYSMAYYLYTQGYDVWLTNYRGQGREPTRSYGWWNADIDHYGIYDMKATVQKVRELTGKSPVYVGHSMGSTMAYMYLQGAYYSPGWNFKVESDPALVAERNGGSGSGAVKGLVDLDGPTVPSATGTMQMPGLAWYAMVLPIYLNLRFISRLLPEGISAPVVFIEQILWAIKDALPEPFKSLLASLYSVNPANIDASVLDYAARYAIDGMATHAMAQYADAMACGKLREYYRNGLWGRFRIFPPPLNGPENLYCYSDNMSKVSLPSLVIADATVDLTDPADIKKFYDTKTRNALDEFHVMPGTAHVDVVCGLKAPYDTFPAIGSWLRKLRAD